MIETKFSNLYLAKFLDSSSKPFFPCRKSRDVAAARKSFIHFVSYLIALERIRELHCF